MKRPIRIRNIARPTLRALIKRSAPKQEAFEFLEEHPLIRNLSEYADIIRVDFRKETTTP